MKWLKENRFGIYVVLGIVLLAFALVTLVSALAGKVSDEATNVHRTYKAAKTICYDNGYTDIKSAGWTDYWCVKEVDGNQVIVPLEEVQGE